MMEAIRSSETSVLTKYTRRKIPEDGFLHSHRRENLKSYIWKKLLVAVVKLLFQDDSAGTAEDHKKYLSSPLKSSSYLLLHEGVPFSVLQHSVDHVIAERGV
jgi:hypothetical protein